tara:strand:- start:252 stop:764 length:513 start_codon:yes stop_codon:yes gene_type:complete
LAKIVTRTDKIHSSPTPVNVVLVQPEIPSNTGNIIRLCANTGAKLHLIGPLEFELNNSKMRRAGLDYHDLCSFNFHRTWNEFISKENPLTAKSYAITTRGKSCFYQENFYKNCWIFFGSETKGLSPEHRSFFMSQNHLKIPMQSHSRSLNLGNAVAVCVYEIWRQSNFLT